MVQKLRFDILAFLCLLILSGTLYAGPTDVSRKQTAVVFIGDSSFRMEDYYKIVAEKLKPRFSKLIIGDMPQAEYRKYWWNEKNLLKESTPPSKQELLEFVKTTAYEQILFLYVADTAVNRRQIGVPGIFWGFSSLSSYQATIQVRALLIDTSSLATLSDAEVTQKGPVVDHGNIGAKRGCFRIAMDYLAKTL